MRAQSADERTISRIVNEQIGRDGHNRRGPKRDIEKITQILTSIFRNDRRKQPPLTVREMNFPNITEADLREHLAFLSKFPPERPFLIAERQTPRPHESGAPPIGYKFEMVWIHQWRLMPREPPIELSADICLAKPKPIELTANICLAKAED